MVLFNQIANGFVSGTLWGVGVCGGMGEGAFQIDKGKRGRETQRDGETKTRDREIERHRESVTMETCTALQSFAIEQAPPP